MFNKAKFRASVISAGFTLDMLSKELGINTVTLYRKINGESDFTRKEIQGIRQILNLDIQLTMDIFFS